MGKLFEALMPDGSERTVADFGMGRAALFCDVALLLERYVGLPCGISPDDGQDEHRIDVSLFLPFFERVWSQGWMTDVQSGFLSVWAGHAAGIVENITLQPRRWEDRHGIELPVVRCLRPDEIPSRQ